MLKKFKNNITTKLENDCLPIKTLVDNLLIGEKYDLDLEKELQIDNKKWEKISDEKKNKIWRKHIKDNSYLYLSYNKFKCKSQNFFELVSNLENRKEWDSSTIDIKLLEKNKNYSIYDWKVKSIWPYSNISYLCRQNYYYGQNCFSIITKSLNVNDFQVEKNITRCNNYFSYSYITGKENCENYSLFLDEQKLNIPNYLYSRAVSLIIPSVINDINKSIEKILGR